MVIKNDKKKIILMSKKGRNQHVVPHNGGCAVKGDGNKKVTKITKTEKKAGNIAKEVAKHQKSEVVIHNKNGRISDKDSYGNDSCPPKDKKH